MAQLLGRDLDERMVERLKERARPNNRSLQGEVKALLEDAAAQATNAEIERILEKRQQRWRDRLLSDSVRSLRELRDQ